MRPWTRSLTALTVALMAGLFTLRPAAAAPEYTVINLEMTVNRPAEAVWKKIGGFCDIQVWMKGASCVYTSGTGDVGTNRLIIGRINEVMVSKTDLSYTYAQPLVPNMYHGSIEAKPLSPTTTKLVYTLLFDVAELPDQAAKDAARARLTKQFTAALESMKAIAEAP